MINFKIHFINSPFGKTHETEKIGTKPNNEAIYLQHFEVNSKKDDLYIEEIMSEKLSSTY